MYDPRRVLLLALVLRAALTVAQQPGTADTLPTRRLMLHAGGGLTYYPRPVGTPQHLLTSPKSLDASGMVRLLWLPGHRLRVGIESGWTPVYSYGIDGPGPTGDVKLTAIPLLLVWSMPVTKRLDLFAGYGAYRLTSELNYLGTAVATSYKLGYAASASYTFPVHRSLGVDVEVEWYNIAEARHTLLAARLGLVWNLYRW